MICFKYDGEAVGKGRPRVSRRGNYVHTYTPEKTRVFEEALLYSFMASTSEELPVYKREVALKADVYIGMSIPKSFSKKKREACLSGELMPSKKPDIDNILKAIFDALNGYAYEDDAQIVHIVADKFYAESPYVEVIINELR